VSATLPSDLAQLVDQLRVRFRERVEADIACEEIPDLLKAEELVMSLVREAGLGMLQDYVDTRAEQALSHRVPCKCGVL